MPLHHISLKINILHDYSIISKPGSWHWHNLRFTQKPCYTALEHICVSVCDSAILSRVTLCHFDYQQDTQLTSPQGSVMSSFHSHMYSLTAPGQTQTCSPSLQLHYFTTYEWNPAVCIFLRLFHLLNIISLKVIQLVSCIDSLFLLISK